jgi:hypothetical protein
MPIQIFNWTSRPDPAFEVNAAAAGFVLMAMVTVDERRRDLSALQDAQEHQVVMDFGNCQRRPGPAVNAKKH